MKISSLAIRKMGSKVGKIIGCGAHTSLLDLEQYCITLQLHHTTLHYTTLLLCLFLYYSLLQTRFVLLSESKFVKASVDEKEKYPANGAGKQKSVSERIRAQQRTFIDVHCCSWVIVLQLFFIKLVNSASLSNDFR